ncbi:glycosyltransferase family 4 protein [Paenibacillus sp. V4I5]|uniref:glycosyltransferase family 4 protein n=1 Tax=Paenibacillus sp. V4I5 TaxID=3042306 RepID=UPI0027947A2A|nr:glycosyltransferase [Paenibacillus sp. V4I5]MDQ0919942.1 glycosyltransferase involved in cell wall biosynthesis [Paenibacillus sp. V4I5]
MRLLFIFYIPSGGVETLNRQRCRALKERGVECHCLYLRPGTGVQNAHNIPTFITNDEFEIQKIVRDGNYTAIIVVSAYYLIPIIRQTPYNGIIIFEVQGFGLKEQARGAMIHAKPFITPHTNALLNPKTPHIKALFRELYPTVNQYEFNNCMDVKHFTYRSLPKKDFPIIAWFGRIEDNKNWSEFLHIGHRLVQRYPTLKLWMFEDHTLSTPEERDKFQKLAVALSLENRLVLRSNVPYAHMPEYFSMIGDSGGFMCSTSKSEGAPYAIIEAMSCRCPVLTTDLDGVQSSVIHNVTGKYYTLGNIAEAVQQGVQIMEDKTLRATILNKAQQHIVTNFAPEPYCKQFLSMLSDLRGNK